jgi:hypothetical protein
MSMCRLVSTSSLLVTQAHWIPSAAQSLPIETHWPIAWAVGAPRFQITQYRSLAVKRIARRTATAKTSQNCRFLVA